MRKNLMVVAVAAFAMSASADITVNVNPATGITEYAAEYAYVSDLVKPRRERPESNKMSGPLDNGTFTLPGMADGAARYIIPAGEGEYVVVYAEPGDNIMVDINSINPLDYKVSGSKLMEDVSALDRQSAEIYNIYKNLKAAGEPDPEMVKQLQTASVDIFKKFIAENPASPAAGYAMMNLEGEDFLAAFDAMSPEVKEGMFYPMLVQQQAYEVRAAEAAKKRAVLESGTVDAPDFTFDDVNGRPVSLSDFRGKWVIIDFWGSWCPWCIKGFPKLKEAYAQYKPELEVIGVDCKDPKDRWENALKKYELPWVNVYNPDPEGGQVLKDYAVEGFPTKAIVNPEGKIVNITVGEDPDFFNILAKLMKK